MFPENVRISVGAERYHKQKEAGLCVTFECKNTPLEGRARCLGCQEYHKLNARKNYKPKPIRIRIPNNKPKKKKTADEQYFWKIYYKFGWSKEDYYALLEKQGGKCANPNCFQKTATATGGRMHLDHDDKLLSAGFKYESIRGILCHACNTFLGKMNEDVSRIEGLAYWLDQQHSRQASILQGKGGV